MSSSNDVIGLQDLYLQLDISNSNFETVVDEIASGLDPSGSNYITSSSYANGNLVRAGGRNSDITTTTTSSAVPSTSGGGATLPHLSSGIICCFILLRIERYKMTTKRVTV